jgi:hypothetical protein
LLNDVLNEVDLREEHRGDGDEVGDHPQPMYALPAFIRMVKALLV